MTPKSDRTLLSVVLPAYNEIDNIRAVYEEISSASADLDLDIEIIFVDDGSSDGTAEAVEAIHEEDERVVLVQLSRNFGHQSAVMAGLSASRGDAVVTMDADLQHPPRFIRPMIEAWYGGSMVVQMVRSSTVGASISTRLTSGLFYRFINRFSSVPVTANASDFYLLDRKVVSYLLEIGHGVSFLRGMIGWLGFQRTEIEYVAQERHAGESKYSLGVKLRLARDAFTTLSKTPLRLSLVVGVITAVGSMGLAVFYFIAWLSGDTVPGWASIVIPILIMGSMQLIILGVIGEYVGLIYDRTRRLPPYVVQPSPAQRKRLGPILRSDRTAAHTPGASDSDRGSSLESPPQ